MTGTGGAAPRTAVVTGASRGLGLTLARYLAARGFHLVLTARGADALAAAAAELSRQTTVTTLAGDVVDCRHRRALAELAGGRVDLLVNNASELGPTPLPPLLELAPERLEHLFAVNAVAPLALVQELAPALTSSAGWVINISSDAATGGYPGWGGYGASKAALDLLSRTLAAELADVVVVSVDPGDMRTAMQQAAFPGEDISDRPTPEATIPFWAWLLEQAGNAVDGRRFQAQAELWVS